MRKTFDIIGWVLVFFTVIALILTILTTYHFVYLKYFNSYFTLQFITFLTMVFWSIKMFDFKAKYESYGNMVNCFLSMLIAAGTAFFMYMKIY